MTIVETTMRLPSGINPKVILNKEIKDIQTNYELH